MNKDFCSKLYTKNVSVKTLPNAMFDVEIQISNSHVTMIFYYNPCMYISHEISIAVIPLIFKNYKINIKELRRSFKQINEESFSLEFDYPLFSNVDSNIEDIVKSILLNNKVKEDEILEINYSSNPHKNDIGIIYVTLDCYEDEGKFKHEKFLQSQITKATFVKSNVEIR